MEVFRLLLLGLTLIGVTLTGKQMLTREPIKTKQKLKSSLFQSQSLFPVLTSIRFLLQ